MAAEFSLNTQMFLLSKKEMWLSDGSMGFAEGTDAAFTEGKPKKIKVNLKFISISKLYIYSYLKESAYFLLY